MPSPSTPSEPSRHHQPVLGYPNDDPALSPGTNSTRSRAFSNIPTFARQIQHIPHFFQLDPETIEFPNKSCASGTRAEVYRGTQNGGTVAVKVLRISNKENPAKLMEVSTEGGAQRVDMG